MPVPNSITRVVLYLRRSTDRQETSIEDQRSALTAYARKHGYKIVGEYVDAGSGDKTEQRTDFLQMRDEASSGKFSVILCWDQDRFGRFDLLDAGHWITPFRQAGVRLETIAQGAIDWEDLVGQLIYSVNQLGKAQFLRDLSRNTVRGMLARANAGKAGTGGPNPYGYKSKDGEVQERYLSDQALARLRKALEKEQERMKPRPRDLSQLSREIEVLDRKIDRGSQRVFDAPDDIVPTLYRKLEDLKNERDQLKAELEALSCREPRSNGKDNSEIDRAIEALRELGEALKRVAPEDTKELLSSIVTRIEVHFEPGTGRQKRSFSHGTIYIRPDAGEGWGNSSPDDVTHLRKLGPQFGTRFAEPCNCDEKRWPEQF